MQEKMEEKMNEMQEEMKEMQEKLAAQEAIITEMNRAIPVSTQNTNPGTEIEAEDTHLLVTGRRHLGRRDYVSSAEVYPASTDCSPPSLPASRLHHTMFVTAKPTPLVATCGGIDGKFETASCLVLDPLNNRWDKDKMGDLTMKRVGSGAVTIDHVGVYVLGGDDESGGISSDFLAAGTMDWQSGPPLPRKMSWPCVVPITNTSFLAISERFIHEFDASMADPTSGDGWQMDGSFSHLRLRTRRVKGHGCAKFGQKVIITGGAQWPDLLELSRTEVLDMKRGVVTYGGDMALPRKSFYLATIVSQGRERLFAVSGEKEPPMDIYNDIIEEWVEEFAIWKRADYLVEKMHVFGALALPRDLVCPPLSTQTISTTTTSTTTPRPCTLHGACPTITSVEPHQLQTTTARTLRLVIDDLPKLTGNYQCTFSALGKVLTTNATQTETGLSCTTPRNDLLPAIPEGESHFTSKLSVRVTEGPDLAATNFTFFDCNAFSSCSTCVSSLFPCDWCIDGHQCTHDTSEHCRNDLLVSGVSQIRPSPRVGPEFCPKMLATGGQPRILTPSGVESRVEVTVDNIAQFMIQTRFACQFNIEGNVTSVNAFLGGDNVIHCEKMEFSYTSKEPTINATLVVVWGGGKPLDNPDNIHLELYKCPEMATNCGRCMDLKYTYQCAWCKETERCELTEYGAHECYTYKYDYDYNSSFKSIRSRSSAIADHHGDC